MCASHPPALSRRPDTARVPQSKYPRASLAAATRAGLTCVTSSDSPLRRHRAKIPSCATPRQPEIYLAMVRLPRKINGCVMATRRPLPGARAGGGPSRSRFGGAETKQLNGIFLEDKRLYVRLDIERGEVA